ncbi:MAG: hypothetical protein A2306_05170 [Omnitrophica WOR_2 bacterium RIFOXYB2_FULL_38_16]|nr:MAG: hypothetical protein A2267_00675 [Omnitrophica WOR_2 bacterium RIFOXYA12_FULL_38_10]OGX59710.1 MAG: hypothetical protein A2306_05170 [Omnitrophica WOR_2 bacterium RIFOXYB2_FULL_38_16]
MNFYLIGMDHRTASSELRDKAFKNRYRLELFCKDFLLGQAGVLFTCNRIELYGVCRDQSESIEILNKSKDAFPEIFENVYLKKDTYETLLHVLRLACGLESQIPFESQIVEQLRSWIKRSTIPEVLKIKLSFVLDLAEDIRSTYGIDGLKKDIVDFALENIQQRIGSLNGKRLLVIGTGKVAELISRKDLKNTHLIFVARKRNARALNLSRKAKGELLSFDDIPKMFNEVDAVVSATSSPHYIIKIGMLFNLKRNRNMPLYIYDLAAPKDVHPEVFKLNNVRVYDVAEMSLSIDNYRQEMSCTIKKVNSLIESGAWLNAGEGDVSKDQSRIKAELVSV